MILRSLLLLGPLSALALPALLAEDEADAPAQRAIDFAREVRPILAEHCFACHGPDEATREGELRLDTHEGLFGDRGGYSIVAPGSLEQSEMWLRLSDEVEPMPPLDAESRPSDAQRETLRLWIEQGAAWERHWAFEPPSRPPLPEVARADWPRGEIDRFVLARLEAEGLAPAEEAGRAALLRRITLDLTGLPPTPEELDAYLADVAPDAYERAVERLLVSPHYGERQALAWLDLARYADTNGDGYDGERAMWPWRDYVIRSFNENKPFDEFTVEQIAGDLLPDATREQRLATGFQRNHTIFTKPGVAENEYRFAYVVDRVNTVSTVWMGLTMACVQCHDHKYDPISQREYYRFYSYFNNAKERDVGSGRGNTSPTMVVPSEEQAAAIDALAAEIEPLEQRLTGADPARDAAQEQWALAQLERLGPPFEWEPLAFHAALSLGGSTLVAQADGSLLATGDSPAGDTYHLVAKPGARTITALRIEALPDPSLPEGGSGRSEKGSFALNELSVNLSSILQADGGEQVRFLRAEDDVEPEREVDADRAVDGSDGSGWSLVGDETREPHEAIFVPEEPLELNGTAVLRIALDQEYRRLYRNTLGRFRVSVTSDERVLRRRFPVLPKHWHAVGPFPASDTKAAFATEFEPEKTIAAGVDLKQKFDKVELEKQSLLDKKKEKEAAEAAAAAEGGADEGAGEAPPDARAGTAARSPELVVPAGVEPVVPAGAEPVAQPAPEPAPKPEAGSRGGDEDKPAGDGGDGDDRGFDFENFDPDEFDGDGPPPGFGGRRGRDSSKLAWEEKPDWREGQRAELEGKDTAWYWTRVLDSDAERDTRILFEGARGLRAWLNGALVFEKPVPDEAERERRRGFGGGFEGDFDGGGDGGENGGDSEDDFENRRARRAPSYEHFDVKLNAGENRLVLKVVIAASGTGVRVRTQALGDDVLSYAAEQALYRELGEVDVAVALAAERDAAAEECSAQVDDPAEASASIAAASAGDTGGSTAAGDEPAALETGAAGAPGAPSRALAADESPPDPATAAARLSERGRAAVRGWYRRWIAADTRAEHDELARLRRERARIEAPLPTVMVMNDDQPRETFVLKRGEWSQPTEKVTPGVPSVLPPLPPGAPENRLALANWLVSGAHPLTARVTVNRIWQQYFGTGLVDTTNDFGTRGALPSHPELLDWLAVELSEGGWDLKAMHRRIVTSATYRQSARATAELALRDPQNRLLARGPRERLTAEMVRDNALAVAGLLVREIGGESVKPYQPEKVWESVGGGFGASSYRRDKGDKLYRRGLYVFWKRGVLFPQFALFDAPTRQVCTSERIETNTPLQALAILNDEGLVEAARALGTRMLTEGGTSDAARLVHGFRLCTSRLPSEAELSILLRVLGEQRAHFAGDEKAAEELVKVGESKAPEELDVKELAAFTSIGNMLLGLDATIHKG